ncbi:MAG: fasciclin domain-containing protein [Verrucomicrobiales bacterium]|nr:fasciclin domain-containing protein [Verrucomicrobiales bacterium]
MSSCLLRSWLQTSRLAKSLPFNGAEATVTTEGGVKIDDATVVKTDIAGSNGVIHVIDSVIMPK